jgi:hypothetical protein
MEVAKVNTPWYHGSPYELTTIHKGGTITKNKDLARIFSHKPPCVSIDDNCHMKHNGSNEGHATVLNYLLKTNKLY